MKKIAFALVALLVALSPLAAGESWVGVTTGPSFDIQKNGEEPVFTDFGWDANIEGAYYFDQAETLGIGVKLGFGFNYDSTYEMDLATSMAPAIIGMIPDTYLEKVLPMVEALDIPVVQNPSAGIKIAPAVTFQYRLALANNLSVRFGAGIQYIHTFGEGVDEVIDTSALAKAGQGIGLAIPQSISIKSAVSIDAIEIIANADVAYSLGDIQIFGGVDFGFTVMTYLKQTTEVKELDMKSTAADFITDGFGFSITPRIGVSYAF